EERATEEFRVVARGHFLERHGDALEEVVVTHPVLEPLTRRRAVHIGVQQYRRHLGGKADDDRLRHPVHDPRAHGEGISRAVLVGRNRDHRVTAFLGLLDEPFPESLVGIEFVAVVGGCLRSHSGYCAASTHTNGGGATSHVVGRRASAAPPIQPTSASTSSLTSKFEYTFWTSSQSSSASISRKTFRAVSASSGTCTEGRKLASADS